jgi:hypothetical protein
MALPLETTLPMLSTKWKSQLDPVLANPFMGGHLISNMVLTSGDNTINHGLGAKLQGWVVVGNTSGGITFFDKQANNPSPQLTLILNVSGNTTVSLWVF